jgi:hypothetical protein
MATARLVNAFWQIEILILQHTLLEQEEKSCVATEESLLVVAEQYIELTIGQGWRFIYKIFAGGCGR